MLSIKRMSPGQEGYYEKLAREDYYLEGGEPPGHWFGEARATLALQGQVGFTDLTDVFSGVLRGESLVRTGGRHPRCPGWDLTFSAPKSVSTLWSQADLDTARKVQEAQQAAVEKALAYIEEQCGVTRRGHGGRDLERVKCLFATFEHGTSRAEQPQLHTHALMLNLGIRADGTSGTIRSDFLYKHKMAAGALYRAELAQQLGKKLGLETVRDGSSFRVVGVDQKLCEHFSERRRQIEAALERLGEVGAVASSRLAVLTRTSKRARPRSELQKDWKRIGAEFGFSTKEVDRLGVSDWKTTEHGELLARLSALKGIEECIESNSTFTEKELVRFSAQVAQGQQIGSEAVLDSVRNELRGNEGILALGSLNGEAHYTTRDHYELEQKLVRMVQEMRDAPSLEVDEDTIQEAIANAKDPLTEEQQVAIRQVLNGEGKVSAIVGDAGTGKTTILRPVREALEASGYQVRGAALAGKAAEGMQEGAGIESRTIKSLVYCLDVIENGWSETEARIGFANWVAKRRENDPTFDPTFSPERSKAKFVDFAEEHGLTEKTVLILDEAAMVDTKNTFRLVDHAKRAGAKIVFIGDAKQLQSIEAGGAFSKIVELVDGVRLTEVFRQREEGERNAVEHMAEGRVREALGYFAENGALAVSEDRRKAQTQLIQDWAKTGVEHPQRNLILAGTNLDVVNLNRAAQQVRLATGRLGLKSMPVGNYELRQGDRVVFGRRNKQMGVENGSFGVVSSISTALGTVTVELDGSGKSANRRRTFSLNSYKDLRLGYATTTHKAQGSTVSRAYVLTDEAMIDRQISYVQLSRAKDQTRIYTTREQAGDELRDLVRQMMRDREKQLAIQKERLVKRERTGRISLRC